MANLKMAKEQRKTTREARKAQCEAKVNQRPAEPPSGPPGEVVETMPEGEFAHLAYLAVHGSNVPQTFCEATRGPNADKWWDTMHEEIAMHT